MSNVLELAPGGARKIVLATDMAETAVFIPGIAYVVDSGVLSKIRSRGSPRRRQTGGQQWPASPVRATATGSTWRTSTLGSTSTPSRT